MPDRELNQEAAEGAAWNEAREDGPFLETLDEVVATGSSGHLEVGTGIESIGKVVLIGGRVAWATCVYQPEKLGQLLQRLGHLTENDLDRVSSDYVRHGGKVKLGRLLEQAGLISRPVLRRCLLIHVRTALACMLSNRDLRARWTPESCVAEDDLAFPLDQVLLGLNGGSHQLRTAGNQIGHLATELDQLRSVDGFKGAVVTTGEGASVASVGYANEDGTEVQELALVSSALLVETRASAPHSSIGAARTGFIESASGAVLASWIDEHRNLIVAVAVDGSARLGVAKHRLEHVAQRLDEALQQQDDQSLPTAAATE